MIANATELSCSMLTADRINVPSLENKFVSVKQLADPANNAVERGNAKFIIGCNAKGTQNMPTVLLLYLTSHVL